MNCRRTASDVSPNDMVPNGAGGINFGSSTITGSTSSPVKLQEQVENLQQDMQRRQESYIRRERQYRVQIDELENALMKMRETQRDHLNYDLKMDDIRSVHREIQSSVAQVQERTTGILQEQEKDLLRAFRARLYDVQTELEKEKNKTDDGAAAWIEKAKQLEAESDWTKEMADRLDRLNQSLTRENLRLKNQFTSQENDREYLVQQLVAVKKDNVRLRDEHLVMTHAHDELLKAQHHQNQNHQTVLPLMHHHPTTNNMKPSTSSSSLSPTTTITTTHHHHHQMNIEQQPSRPHTSSPSSSATLKFTDAESNTNRYKEIIKRLKKILEVERRNLKQVRQAYTSELQERSELETFLRQCIEDLRVDIMQRKSQQERRGPSSMSLTKPSLKEFTQENRQRIMENLLAQERVIHLLYTKTFPIVKKQQDVLSGKLPPANFGPSPGLGNISPKNPPSNTTHPTVSGSSTGARSAILESLATRS